MGNRERILWLATVVALSIAIGVVAWQNCVQWRELEKHQAQLDNTWKFIEDQGGTIGELQAHLDDLEQEGRKTGEYVYRWMEAATDWIQLAANKINELENRLEQEDGRWEEGGASKLSGI